MESKPIPRSVTARDTGSATAEAGGYANSGVHYGDVYLTAPAPARSAYLHQVEQIFPWRLVGRETELAELARFCTAAEGPSYAWWQGPAWAGKSALMAWFVLHPPRGVRLLPFFVTARWVGQSDRTAFLDVMLEQLAEIARRPLPSAASEATRPGWFGRLLAEAAGVCAQTGERLVLLVDGLDEDRGVTAGTDAHSIAALLPAKLPDGVRVLVAGRPDPPVPADVPSWHPLRSPQIVRWLSTSPQARIVRDDAVRELDRLLDSRGPEHDILGFVATAGGGLSSADLAELTQLPERLVARTMRAVSGRTFQRRDSQWRHGPVVFTLAHEELQNAAVADLGPAELSRYRDCLHTWADSYRQQGWPEDTPEYLLRGYYRLLHDTGDLPRMVAYATDSARLDRMLDISGGDATAFTEIALAQGFVCEQDEPDLVAMLDLAATRYRVSQRNTGIPPGLPAAWATLGHVARAEALARSISGRDSTSTRVEAFNQIAEVLVSAGDLDHAEEIFRAEHPTWVRGVGEWHPLAGLVKALVAAGEFERAVALSRELPGWYPEMSAVLAQALISAGELEYAEHVVRGIGEPEHVLRRVGDPPVSVAPLIALVRAQVAAGDRERARDLARWGEETLAAPSAPGVDNAASIQRARLMTAVAMARCRAGDTAGARRLADEVEELAGDLEAAEQLEALALLLPLREVLEEPDQVARLRRRSEALLHAEGMPGYMAPGINELIRALVKLGDHDGARRMLPPAVKGAYHNLRREPGPWHGSRDLLELLGILADLGDTDRMVEIVQGVDDPGFRAEAVEWMALELTDRGVLDRAEAAAAAVEDEDRRRGVVSRLVLALGYEGSWERASTLARELPDRVHLLLLLAELAGDDADQARGLARQAAAAIEELSMHSALRAAWLAHAWALAGDSDRSSALSGEAVDLVRTVDDPGLQAWVWLALARTRARAGDMGSSGAYVTQAAAAASGVADLDVRTEMLAALADWLLEQGRLAECVELLPLLTDPYLRAMVLSGLADRDARSEGIDRMEELAQQALDAALSVQDPDARIRALSELASMLADLGYLDAATTVVNEIDAPPARVGLLIRIMDRWVDAEARAEAVALADEAELAAKEHALPELRGKAAAYTAAVWAAAGEAERAGDYLQRAEWARRSVTELFAYLALATDIVRVHMMLGQSDEARACAEEADDLARQWAAPDRRWALKARLAEAWLAAGLPDRAYETARTLTAPDETNEISEPDEWNLTALLDAFITAAELERAERLASSVDSSESKRSRLLGKVALAWVAHGAASRAAAVVSPDTQAAVEVVRALAALGDSDAARRLAERIEAAAGEADQRNPDAYDPSDPEKETMTAWAVQAWAAAGEAARAVALARALESDLRTAGSPDSDKQLLYCTRALAAVGELDRAQETAQSIPNTYWRACAQALAAEAAARAGEVGQAGELLRLAEAATDVIDNDNERGFARAALVKAFAVRDLDRARAVVASMPDAEWIGRADARGAVARRLIELGELEDAERVVLALPSHRREDDLPLLLDALTAAAETAKARAIVDTVTEPRVRAAALNWLLGHAMAENDVDMARSAAEQLHDFARTQVEWDDQGWVLKQVVDAWITVGDLEQAESVARSIGDPAERASALISLIAPHYALDGGGRAQELAVEAEAELHQAEWDRRRYLLRGLARAWAAIGDLARARELAETPDRAEDRAYVLASLSRLAGPPESRWFLALALRQSADYHNLLDDLAELEPAAVAAARLP